jgi:hypothetical protein
MQLKPGDLALALPADFTEVEVVVGAEQCAVAAAWPAKIVDAPWSL